MKRRKQILSILMTVCMVIAMLPVGMVTAWAEEDSASTGKAIQLVRKGIVANITEGQVSSVWFGKYKQSAKEGGEFSNDPIKWRVLENKNKRLFLISDQILDSVPYQTERKEVTWARSTMRSWLNGYDASANSGGDSGIDYSTKRTDSFIGSAFTFGEQEVIAETDVKNVENPTYHTSGGENTQDKLFLLSIEEATNTDYGFANSYDSTDIRKSTNTAYTEAYSNNRWWWLRSPGKSSYDAAVVTESGKISPEGNYVYAYHGKVRPAFNLNLNSLLFTSAAEGGKTGDGSLEPVPDYTGTDWKLTIKDGDHNSFKASISNRADNSVTVNYSGAKTGTDEYISAVIVNSAGEITYYGKIKQVSSDNDDEDTLTIDLENKIDTGDSLYVFNEQCNGDYKTDYASELQMIPTLSNQVVYDGGVKNLEAGCNTENAATVWFGKDDNDNNASWRVIGYNGDGVASENGTITLLASKNMGLSNFGNNNQYKNSVLHYQMHTLDNKLTTKEKAAVVKRELNGNSANQGEDGYDSDHISGESVDDALYWPLSVAEAENVNEKIRLADPEHTSWRSSTWWLRTPGSGINEEAVVDADGEIINYGRSIFMNDIGIRPAFHLNLNSILFTSAAVGGKIGDGSLEPVYYYTDADWKLTLRDDTREFSVTEKSVTANPGQSVNLNYRNATVNNDKAPNEYISAILANKDDNLLYYGRLIKPIGPDGQIRITIPNELEAGKYTLKLFNEQYNGDYMTDYASSFSDVKLTVYASVQDCPKDDTCPITPFTDTNKNAWYHDGVHWALQKVIMYGTSDNTFEPMTPTTRAMLVTMLWRMEGAPIVDYQMSFTDVRKSQWYTEAIRWAAANDIVNGYDEKTFGTNNNVTREQLATILYRSAQAKGKGFQGGWAFLLDFDDADQVSVWADEAMHWMVMKGVINGVSERELSPGTDAVRAQVATMLMRFNEKVS